jgi:tellurite resistance protein
MSLFDRVSRTREQSSVALSPAESFAAITLVAVAADGYLSDEESQSISTTLCRMQLFRSYPREVIGKLFDRLCAILKRQGSEALLDLALNSLPHDLYETAFAVTADLVLADGEVSSEEEDLLNQLYRVLGISEATAVKIIDVMLIKNRG